MLKKRFMILFVTVVLCAFSLHISLLPEENADQKKKEDESMFTEVVEVVGKVPVVKTIESVSIFKSEDIETLNCESLKSVLQMTPGLLTLSAGQFGQASSTYIRGSKNTQVLYIVDGIKLRDGANIGGITLAVLSPNLVNRVEVVRGPLSHIYGSDAMGGVVSMNTDSKEGANFMASIGSHGSYLGNFSGTANLNAFTLGLSVNTQRYSDNVENDLFKNTGLSARLNFKNEKINAGLRAFGNLTDSGIPFNDGIPSPNRHYKQDYYILALPLVFTLSDAAKLDVKLAYTHSKYEFEDPNDLWGAPYFKNKFNNYEAEVTYNGRFFEKVDVWAGLDYSDQEIFNETSYGKTLDNVKMNYFSSFVSTALNLNALQISASVRYDKYKDVAANFSPHIGVSYLLGNKFKLRTSYSRSFLAPMVSQMVNPWGSPNFDLKPEKGKSFEIGGEFYSEKLVLSATYFAMRYRDMIDWVTIDWETYTGQYQNIAAVDTGGVELSATFRPVYRLTLSGSYTYLHTKDRATGKQLIRKPKHTFSGFLTYAHKRFTVSASFIYVGKRPDLDYQSWPPYVESPAFDTFDFSLVVPVTAGFSVYGKLTNAFDRNYQEFIGYPAPGRRFELGIKYRIN